MAIEGYKVYMDDGATHLFVADNTSIDEGVLSFHEDGDWICSFVLAHVVSVWPIENIEQERDAKDVLKG